MVLMLHCGAAICPLHGCRCQGSLGAYPSADALSGKHLVRVCSVPLPSQHTVVLHSLKKVSFTYLHIQMYIDFFFQNFNSLLCILMVLSLPSLLQPLLSHLEPAFVLWERLIV